MVDFANLLLGGQGQTVRMTGTTVRYLFSNIIIEILYAQRPSAPIDEIYDIIIFYIRVSRMNRYTDGIHSFLIRKILTGAREPA